MGSFTLALEKKKFYSHLGNEQKPFVVVFHEGGVPHAYDILDALSSLKIPFVLKGGLEPSDDVKKADIMIFFRADPILYKLAFQNLCVPVAPRLPPKTQDYNAVLESGNGFYFHPENKWELFAAFIRACETFQFPYDWENLLREIHKMN